VAYLKQINIYPIKSLGGICVSSSQVGERGLTFDRCMMLVDANGKFLTARKFPLLLALTTSLLDDGVSITHADEPTIHVKYSEFNDRIMVTIWREELQLKLADDQVNQWFSAILKRDVFLVMLTPECIRYREELAQQVSLADGYPLLLIGEESLAELNRRASEPSTMAQFRTNLVIGASDAFAEDQWHKIKIGEVIFELKKPCERCVMTTVDLDNVKPRKSREPLTTLRQFRADPKGRLMFGENLIALNTGVINVGDTIEVLTTRIGVEYGEK